MCSGIHLQRGVLKADKASRFAYLYDNYRVREAVLSCEKSCLTYMIEMTLMKESWADYCKWFAGQERYNKASETQD